MVFFVVVGRITLMLHFEDNEWTVEIVGVGKAEKLRKIVLSFTFKACIAK